MSESLTTAWTVAHQAPLSMEFSRQEYWSGFHFLLKGNFSTLGENMGSLVLYFAGGSGGKASACNTGDPGSIPGLGRSPGEGNGNLLQYSCLENPRDGGA